MHKHIHVLSSIHIDIYEYVDWIRMTMETDMCGITELT